MKLALNKRMANEEVAKVLSFIAKILLLKDTNLFRSRAYEEAADVIAHLPYQLTETYQNMTPEEFERKMDTLPGIGEAIAAKLRELYETGDVKALQSYVRTIPGGVWALTQIHGIGAKRAVKLAKRFELDNPETAVDELLTKAKHGLIKDIEGFGSKSEEQLIQQLEAARNKGRMPRSQALAIADEVKNALDQIPEAKQVIYLGSLRRGASDVGDIDIGVATREGLKVTEKLKGKLETLTRVLVSGDKLFSFNVEGGVQVDIKYAPPEEWGSFLQYFTGNKQHNIALREIALKKGLSLSEHGIKLLKTGEQKKFATEEEFYRYVGYDDIPPEERVGNSELAKYKL